ncbi:MAG: D-hexose-6-phosphate mutarotase [Pseudomonadales bacterium]|jgi:glucose-6-phosphate 1-epimerase|nr:D-hexose-6-phosphate mutarotase [Pseudomonadales bacterium]
MAAFSVFQKHLNPAVSLLEVSNTLASATLSLFGAQVLHYTPKRDGRERLFLSGAAQLDGSKSIRGGIPLCWPWFGAHPSNPALPAHGFARTRPWYLAAMEHSVQGHRLLLLPQDNHDCGHLSVELEVLIGAQLELRLRTRNHGTTAAPLSGALHTYFAVSDIMQIQLYGLKGPYSDKTRNWAHFDTPAPYRIEAETDRIHLTPVETVTLHDPLGDTRISSKGHDSLVVWNPWHDAHQRFPDLAPEDYRHMLCVETALTQSFMLAPDATHVLTQIIE